MSMLCGKNASLEIIRLDQSVTMNGDAKKKTYTEVPFPTPEQRRRLTPKYRFLLPSSVRPWSSTCRR
jgi:hypothetical protein